jgi:hypothetical protein
MPNLEDFAVVIGINRYPAIRALVGSEKDATEFAKWLGDPEGGDLPPENIRLILSSNYEEPIKDFFAKPVKDDIDNSFIEFGIEEKERVGRRLYFFFAGHGVAPDFDDVALLMANASKKRLGCNIGMRNYRRFFRRAAPFDELVIILDCCREFEDRAEPTYPVFTQRLVQDRAALVQEFYIMAAGYGKKAFEPKQGEDRRGLLSKALIEALKDHKAAVPPTNEITAASVAAYLKDRVPELARNATLEQKPEIPSPPDMILVAAAPAPPQYLASTQVVVDENLGGEVVLRTNELEEIERRLAAQTPWQLTLEPGVYVLTHLPTNQQRVIDARKPQEVSNEYRFP